jgi:hypothetical protein
MSFINKIQTGKVARPQRVVIYAPEGFGKSTLASQFPAPIFLDVEDSTSQMEVARIGQVDLPNLKAVKAALKDVIESKQFQTVVVDTADWLEQMALDHAIREAASEKIKGIEDFGYGKGYTVLKEAMTILLSELDAAIRAGMNVVLLAHSKVVKFEPPDGAGAFDRYELKLSKGVAPVVKEWADMLIFGNWRTQIAESGKGDATKYKGVGGRDRVMHCNRASAWDAKNRHGLNDVEKWDIAVFAKAFASAGAPWGEEKPAAPTPAALAQPKKLQGGTQPKPTASTPAPTTAAATSDDDDSIPGLPPSALASANSELDKILAPHAAVINAYLASKQVIPAGANYNVASDEYKARILKNPAGFIKVATTWSQQPTTEA